MYFVFLVACSGQRIEETRDWNYCKSGKQYGLFLSYLLVEFSYK